MNAFIERRGWVLIHSMWQFAVVALLAAVARRAMQHRAAAARYGVFVGAMALMIVAPAATWMLSDSRDVNDESLRDSLRELASRRALAGVSLRTGRARRTQSGG